MEIKKLDKLQIKLSEIETLEKLGYDPALYKVDSVYYSRVSKELEIVIEKITEE